MNSAAHPKPEHCPDCGAELKPGATWCWLCNYKAPSAGRALAGTEARLQRANWMALTGFILLAIAFVPACLVAFFVSCSALLILDGQGIVRVPNDLNSGMLMGLVGAVVVAVLLVVLMVTLFRSYHRSTLPPEIRHAR